MKKRLGISIYPEHSTLGQDKEYLSLAYKHGFRKVFTCLLSVNHEQAMMNQLKETITYGKELGLEVIVDIAPPILEKLGISHSELLFFHNLGVDGIRLDYGFTGKEEAVMTYNPYDLKIEISMGHPTSYLEQILAYQPNKSRLAGSHNFYPRRYTGLSYAHFINSSKIFKQHGLKTTAFVRSQEATIGPWPVVEGLCTLEQHRTLPIVVQAKHLFATGLIDDVLIGDAYASESELAALGKLLQQEKTTFTVELHETITDLERKIVLEEPHFYRGDASDYMIRSTDSRKKYRESSFPATYTPNIRRGDILIDNELYGQYKGELQIALKGMENAGRTNVVGRVVEEEILLLDYLQPWERFRFEGLQRE